MNQGLEAQEEFLVGVGVGGAIETGRDSKWGFTKHLDQERHAVTGGLKRQDATLSLADRQEVDQKIQGRWGVGGWRMCSWKADGEAVAYPWVTVVFPCPPLTPNPPQKRHLLSILCARH